MNILVIGADEGVFDPASAVRSRIKEYARGFDSMQIICKTRSMRSGEAFENIILHPVRPWLRALFVWHTYKIGKKVLSRGGQWVVTTQDPFETGLAGWWLARRYRYPLQVQVHTDCFSPYFRRENLRSRFQYWLARFLIPRAACLRVVSERIKRSIEAKHPADPKKIRVLPIWSAPPEPRFPEAGRFNVLMAARLEPEKEIPMALRAFARFIARGGRGRLIIAGSGSLEKDLRYLGKKLLGAAVEFLGWQHSLAPFYRKADVFLVTSRYEGWGVSAAEAALAHVPVVTTDVGLAGEAVVEGRNGIVVPMGDEEAIAEALLKLFRDQDFYNLLAHSPFPRVWPHSFAEYAAEYRALLRNCSL